ncbi:MAG TPA: alpha-amylase family glycosyl hydrolase, partial [Candidatus Binatia bacterium]|nr:alpha-amylase family glycosyl hydrolase [Candidatus Binatia bacterium]
MMARENTPAPRHVPQATYRFQFNRDFTLRQATKLVPYLQALGISHVYASPLLKACAGSRHGYDVCDCSQLNPEIGTEAELESLVKSLRAHGMGLVLDIVPNHMAASSENPWWWDVLKHGRQSRYANHFDIEWDSPNPQLLGKVLVPVLGDECERVLAQKQLTVAVENDTPILCYFDHRFPLSPDSVSDLEANPTSLNENPRTLAALLEKQHYRLAFWRHADRQINYRRFFNITTLAGVRVEDPQVFQDTHARILDWYQRGFLDGLRIDHPDGLRDPQAYLAQLRQAAPDAWIVVEKILEPGESLPEDWPVAGTTGYDFLNRNSGLFVNSAAEAALTEFYQEFSGETTDYETMVRHKKR